MTALLTTAYIYGVQAVSWVVANANWLIKFKTYQE